MSVLLAFALLTSAIGFSSMQLPNLPQQNLPPVADAGPDQTANMGEQVLLDGSNSYDPDGTEIGPNIRMNDMSGGNWQTAPSIAVDDDGNVFAAWGDYRNGDYDIYFSRLPSGGTAFEENIRVNDDVGYARQSRPSMAIAPDGRIYIAWEDFRNDNWDIYYSVSTDGGLSFSANSLMTMENGTNWQSNPSIAVDSSRRIHAVWEDDREGNWSIYYANSSDGFKGNTKVNSGLPGGNHWSPSIGIGESGTIHVVWETNNDIYYSRSTDGGLTFGPPIRVNDDVGDTSQAQASLAVETGGRIHVVWEDMRSGDADIYYSQSIDDGLTFGANIRINDDASAEGQASPWISVEDGEFVHIVWADGRRGEWDIFYTVSFDGGLSFQPNLRIDDYYRPATQTRPSVVAEGGGHFHVGWKDARWKPAGLLYDVFYARGKASKLSFDWDFGDGTTHGADARVAHTYSSPGVYGVTLTVTDSDGAKGTDDCLVTVLQLGRAPIADLNGPYVAEEGDQVTLDASGSYDPDNDPLQYRWDLNGDGSWDSNWSSSPYLNYTWGDDYLGDVVVEVSDGRLSNRSTATLLVGNIDPKIKRVNAYLYLDLSLRVSGEKWHNVEVHIYEEGSEIGYAEVVRRPGSPDNQIITISGLRCNATRETVAKVLYTPNDDPVNGQMNGANPVWVVLTFEDGSNTTLRHVFNVMQPEGWEWGLELQPHFIGHEITFEAMVEDPGSDDLTLIWNWSDGSPDSEGAHYNNGISPDPYPSPEVSPITVTESRKHTFLSSGMFMIALSVEDDDGGAVEQLLELKL